MRSPPPSSGSELLRPARVVIWLLVSFFAVLAYMLYLPGPALQGFVDSYGFVPAEFSKIQWTADSLNWDLAHKLLPLISYSFLHGGLVHLAFNGLGFLLVATIAVRRMGEVSFLLFSFVTGIFAALTFWAFHQDSTVPMVGASGMLSGIIGGTSRFAMIDLRGTWGRDGGTLSLTDRRFILFSIFWLVLNYFFGVWGVGTTSPDQAIAWEAHMGGYIAGVLLFPLFDWRKPLRTPGMLVYEEIP